MVGVDGSDSSLAAVDWAADEAERHGVALRLVYGSLWEHYERIKPALSPDRASERMIADHIVASSAERAERRAPDVKVSAEVLSEDPTSALLDEGKHAFALVVGHRGRGEVTDWLLGSTSLTVAARARCPVVVVRGRWNGGQERPRVVLGVSDRGEGKAAAAFALREAELSGGRLEAVRAWRRSARAMTGDRAAHDEVARLRGEAEAAVEEALYDAATEHRSVGVTPFTVEGSPRAALLNAAPGADLLVVGARRRSGGFGWQLGPVNHAVLHHSPCPVAVVPEH